jgi:hypothetical protein
MNGNTHAVHKTRTVRRDTWAATEIYSPYYWEDISCPFPDIGTASLTRLTFGKSYVFADVTSANHFRSRKQVFVRMNRRDIHYDFNESFDINGAEMTFLRCHYTRNRTFANTSTGSGQTSDKLNKMTLVQGTRATSSRARTRAACRGG